MSAALDGAVQALLRETAERVIMPRYRNLRAGDVIDKGSIAARYPSSRRTRDDFAPFPISAPTEKLGL